jgi:hypothetical protein
VRSRCGPGIWGDPGPLSTLGTVNGPLQTVLRAPDSGPAASCASAYASQGARVPQRFCTSQMFQRSVKSFSLGLGRVVRATRGSVGHFTGFCSTEIRDASDIPPQMDISPGNARGICLRRGDLAGEPGSAVRLGPSESCSTGRLPLVRYGGR